MFIWLSPDCRQRPCPPTPASALNVPREQAPGCRSAASPRRLAHMRDADQVSTRQPAMPACHATTTRQDHAPGDRTGRPREHPGAWPRIDRERRLGLAAISFLRLLLLRSFFFAPRKSAFDRAGIDGYAEAAPDRFDKSFFALGTPLLDEV